MTRKPREKYIPPKPFQDGQRITGQDGTPGTIVKQELVGAEGRGAVAKWNIYVQWEPFPEETTATTEEQEDHHGVFVGQVWRSNATGNEWKVQELFYRFGDDHQYHWNVVLVSTVGPNELVLPADEFAQGYTRVHAYTRAPE